MKIIMCSGGFDPLHIGHLRYLEAASQHGKVIVALNSDDWLYRKKGYVFMPHGDRTSILKALTVVTDVTPFDDANGTACGALRRICPDFFANGGDRVEGDPREHAVCEELSIIELFNIGGKKIQSSSKLVEAIT